MDVSKIPNWIRNVNKHNVNNNARSLSKIIGMNSSNNDTEKVMEVTPGNLSDSEHRMDYEDRIGDAINHYKEPQEAKSNLVRTAIFAYLFELGYCKQKVYPQVTELSIIESGTNKIIKNCRHNNPGYDVIDTCLKDNGLLATLSSKKNISKVKHGEELPKRANPRPRVSLDDNLKISFNPNNPYVKGFMKAEKAKENKNIKERKNKKKKKPSDITKLSNTKLKQFIRRTNITKLKHLINKTHDKRLKELVNKIKG